MKYKTSLALVALAATFLISAINASAYMNYSGCVACHGQFKDGTSPKGTVFPGNNKHDMHRKSSNMGTDCYLCHIVKGDTPMLGLSAGTVNTPGLGCAGCHGRDADMGFDTLSAGRGAGLRQHHYNAGVTTCAGCHTDADPSAYTPVGEDVAPAYYGSVDTFADSPCNPTATANLNENWSTGDFEGSDNDGDLLYDSLDPNCIPGAICGDGIVNPSFGEACDDGNTSNGDCCSSTCQFEALGSSCDDGNPATNPDICDGAGVCVPTLSEWGIFAMALLMLGGVLYLRRRREATA